MTKTVAVLLAGGSGKRFGNGLAKQFFLIGEKTLLEHCLDRFEKHPGIQGIVLVENPDYHDQTAELIKTGGYGKIMKVLSGGKTRQQSSRIGVNALKGGVENVLIHDVARPLVPATLIDRLIEGLKKYPVLTPVLPSPDTLFMVGDGVVRDIPDRDRLKRVQTPQAFKLALIQDAHEKAFETGLVNSPDDCTLIHKAGLADIRVVEGSEFNFKVTFPSDLGFIRELLSRIALEEGES